MVYLAFVLLAALIVFLSIKLSKYVDLLDKTTKVSGAFIGGVLLAAVTSLPELFTSVSAVLFLHENNLVTGNILGSNIFNLAALGTIIAFTFIGFSRAKVGKNHLITLLGCICCYGLIAIALFVKKTPQIGFVNIISPLILAVYIVTVLLTPKTEESNEKEEITLTTKQLISRFVISAVILVAASIAITYVSDSIAEKLNLGKTFAGALLLGISTSLPELVSTVSLCRRGNFNASIGNILGSCIFNFFILFIADVLSFKKGFTDIYPYFRDGTAGLQSSLLLILGAISAFVCAALLLTKCFAPQKKKTGHVVTVSAGALMGISYILFIILSTVLV